MKRRQAMLPEVIKTRVPSEVKAKFVALAQDRHLDLADVARDAFREYLRINKPRRKALAA